MFHSVEGTVKQCSQKGKVSEDFFPQSEMKIWPKRRSSLKFSAGLFKVGVGTFMIFFWRKKKYICFKKSPKIVNVGVRVTNNDKMLWFIVIFSTGKVSQFRWLHYWQRRSRFKQWRKKARQKFSSQNISIHCEHVVLIGRHLKLSK